MFGLFVLERISFLAIVSLVCFSPKNPILSINLTTFGEFNMSSYELNFLFLNLIFFLLNLDWMLNLNSKLCTCLISLSEE
jgi:hypothetical protein